VNREQLDQILRAGMAAPTAVNKQPWSFVAVTDRKALDALREGLSRVQVLNDNEIVL
jgi:nitroreductase